MKTIIIKKILIEMADEFLCEHNRSDKVFFAFMIEQPWDVFKQKISRSPDFSNSVDLVKESFPRVIESNPFTGYRKRLTRLACADNVDVGDVIFADLYFAITKYTPSVSGKLHSS